MARLCGNSQTEVAKDIAEYEMEVEKNIITPFQTVVEVRESTNDLGHHANSSNYCEKSINQRCAKNCGFFLGTGEVDKAA